MIAINCQPIVGGLFFSNEKRTKIMKTLYTNSIKANTIEKETKHTEKLISEYLNQKHIRKIILNGLKNTKYIQFDTDDKTIALKPKFVDIHLTKSNYKYNFTITQNDEIITYLEIEPVCFNSYLEVSLNPYYKEKINLITSNEIMHYLKLAIGID